MKKQTNQKLKLKRETIRKLQGKRVAPEGGNVNPSEEPNAATCGPNCHPPPPSVLPQQCTGDGD